MTIHGVNNMLNSCKVRTYKDKCTTSLRTVDIQCTSKQLHGLITLNRVSMIGDRGLQK